MADSSSWRRLLQVAIQVGLTGMIVVTPWFFGGVLASVQWRLLAIIGLLAGVSLILVVWDRSEVRRIPLSSWPLFGGILLGLLQLTPLPENVARRLAPFSVATYEGLASPAVAEEDVSESGGDEERRYTRTICASATRGQLALLVLATSVFCLSSMFFVRSHSIRHVFLAVTICGVCLCLFGFLQRMTWNGNIYWSVPLSQGGAPFGPFVNRNNAGGFLNVSLACVIGALLLHGQGTRSTGRESTSDDFSTDTTSSQRSRPLWEMIRMWVAQLDAQQLILLSAIILIVAGVFGTASRGSSLSLVFAFGMTGAVAALRRQRRALGMGLIALVIVAVGVLSWLGQDRVLHERLAELVDRPDRVKETGRLPNWKDALHVVPDCWMAGSGLDTYQYVYAPYQHRLSGQEVYRHAENQFIQTLVDAGVLGEGLLILQIVLVVGAIVVLLRSGDSSNQAIGLVGVMAISSQLVGGSFDFGLYLPANFMLMAMISGIVVGRAAATLDSSESHLAGWGRSAGRPVSFGVVTLLVCASLFGARELYRAARVEQALRSVTMKQIDEIRVDDELTARMKRLLPPLLNRWDDVEGHRFLAQMWIQRYRIATFHSLLAATPAAENEGIDEDELWGRASLWQAYATVVRLEANNDRVGMERLRSDPAVQLFLQPAWDHSVQSRQSNPWISHVHLNLAEMSRIVGNEPNDAAHLARASFLAPGNADMLFWKGTHEWTAGRYNDAIRAWKTCLTLTPKYDQAIIPTLLEHPRATGMIRDVLPQSFSRRLSIALRWFVGDEWTDLRRRTAETVLDALGPSTQLSGEMRLWRASALQMIDRNQEAIEELEQAVDDEPFDMERRYQLANSLLRQRSYERALEQATLCVRTEPDNSRFRQLLTTIQMARRSRPP